MKMSVSGWDAWILYPSVTCSVIDYFSCLFFTPKVLSLIIIYRAELDLLEA